MSTGCEFYQDALTEYAAGRLEAARVADVKAHLARCPSCREAMTVLHRLLATDVGLPAGLEERVRRATLEEARRLGGGPATQPASAGEARPRGRPSRWLPWALPAAAAAALALWVGLGSPGAGRAPNQGAAADLAATESYEPFGVWPASDGTVAGDPVLTDLSEEQLRSLLEDMES